MLTIGIDSSTTNTAVVILNNGSLEEFKLFSPKDKDIYMRSEIIVKDVLSYLKEVDKTSIVGIESASIRSVGQRDKLSMLLGAIYYGLRLQGFSVELLPPTTIKKRYSGNGRADKPIMESATPQEIVNAFKASAKKIDDLIDAYAIAKIIQPLQ